VLECPNNKCQKKQKYTGGLLLYRTTIIGRIHEKQVPVCGYECDECGSTLAVKKVVDDIRNALSHIAIRFFPIAVRHRH
jgi:hypothetical protein